MERGSGSYTSTTMEDEEDEEMLRTTTDAELLKRAWRSEKAAPEILQFKDSLVQRSREQIQLQGVGDDNQNSDAKTVVELTNGISENGQERTNDDAPENVTRVKSNHIN